MRRAWGWYVFLRATYSLDSSFAARQSISIHAATGPSPSCVKNRSPSCSLSLMWLEFAKQTLAYSSEKSYQPPCYVHYDNTVHLITIVYIARREKVFSAQYFFEAWCYLESAPKIRGSRTGCTREAVLNMDVNTAVPVECLCVDALS